MRNLTTIIKELLHHRTSDDLGAELWIKSHPFIQNGVCHNDGSSICDLGYACDECPFYSPTNSQ
jgi:hypothetical protein